MNYIINKINLIAKKIFIYENINKKETNKKRKKTTDNKIISFPKPTNFKNFFLSISKLIFIK